MWKALLRPAVSEFQGKSFTFKDQNKMNSDMWKLIEEHSQTRGRAQSDQKKNTFRPDEEHRQTRGRAPADQRNSTVEPEEQHSQTRGTAQSDQRNRTGRLEEEHSQTRGRALADQWKSTVSPEEQDNQSSLFIPEAKSEREYSDQKCQRVCTPTFLYICRLVCACFNSQVM